MRMVGSCKRVHVCCTTSKGIELTITVQHNGELTHKLAVGAVLWEGAGHEVQQATVTPGAP